MSAAPLATHSATQKARVLAEAMPYIRAYHGKTLVIRLGGNAMADPELKASFAQDVALLRRLAYR
jgi:acetylglutamate kinase